jgi:hypothetical protein
MLCFLKYKIKYMECAILIDSLQNIEFEFNLRAREKTFLQVSLNDNTIKLAHSCMIPSVSQKHVINLSYKYKFAPMQQLRSSTQKCPHYRYLTKSFRTGHFLFRLSSIVHYSGCFENHFNFHN